MYRKELDNSLNFYNIVKIVKSILDRGGFKSFSDTNITILISEIKDLGRLPELLNQFLQHDFIFFEKVLKILPLNAWIALFPENFGADAIAHELHIIIDKEVDKTDSLIVVKALEKFLTYGYLREDLPESVKDERVMFQTKLRDKIEAKKDQLINKVVA